MDTIELDAASNNSVDDIRSIIDHAEFMPSVGKYKVYIIDEVHMLSGSAFNAFLKILEEPPAHVKFLLATTEPHKLPETIISRVQRFEFRKFSRQEIIDHLTFIASQE
ncbi:AAA family ATPase [Candidatus Peregrinibacteria bacterium]|nr:AAA family ATPase [Candidatus Peregrinibacteria bacterium]